MAGDGLLRKDQVSQTEPSVSLAGDVTGDNTASVVAKIRGRNVQDVAPSNGEALIWSDSNSRWEPTASTSTWDGIYSNDADGLDVNTNSKPFEISQSSTAGAGLTLSRNLASASTDAALMVISNLNSGDDQNSLEIVHHSQSSYGFVVKPQQANSGGVRVAAPAGVGATQGLFSTYDDNATTERWVTTKEGWMYLEPSSTVGKEAFHINQADTDQPFFKFEGTASADELSSISTVNGATADMIRVVVDDGSSGTRWIPCYSSATLTGGTSTWDDIYDNDANGLDVDTNGKPFKITQTSTSGQGVLFTRNLGTSANALLRLEVKNSSDILPSLYSEYHGSSALDYRGFAFHCDPQNQNSGGLFIGAQASVSYSKPQILVYDQSAATLPFAVHKDGNVSVNTPSDCGREALRLRQLDWDEPFIEFVGYDASDESSSISTANGATADMIQVSLGYSASYYKRWIPCYSSATLPVNIPSWDDIYDNDANGLDIDTSAKPFLITQTHWSGNALKVVRNLSTTNAALVRVEVQDSSDIFSAIYVPNAGSSATVNRAFGFHCETQSANSGGLLVSMNSAVGDTKPQISVYDANATVDRFAIYKPGYMYLEARSDIGKEAFHIYQNDTDEPFIGLKGTTASDETANISSASGSNVDMVRVNVDDGSAADRWVPAYNSATLAITETVFLPIDDAQDTSSSAPATAELISDGTYGRVRVRKFSGSSEEWVVWAWEVPDDIDTSAGIKFKTSAIITEATTPSNEGVVFSLSGYSVGDNDGIDGTPGTEIDIEKTGMTMSQYDRVQTSYSGTVTITNLAAGELAFLAFRRDPAHASDTYEQDVGVSGITVQYKKKLTVA